jgi:FKBP12-rapamycin complex-associated protein
LAKILLLKAPSSEVWFDRRTNFTRSLAVMSMVGYVLGLGDRHPSNLLLDRMSGKILHIDFGDCFEVAMTRDKFPEKIPFRLTRMLINAMEVTGIEGTYRSTCESVMRVLRNNKDSLMAVLEAFVYDPLLNWRLIETGAKVKKAKKEQQAVVGAATAAAAVAAPGAVAAVAVAAVAVAAPAPPSAAGPDSSHSTASNSAATESVAGAAGGEQAAAKEAVVPAANSVSNNVDLDLLDHQPEALNRKALDIIQRVRDKLTGRDFSHDEMLDVAEQVDRLIEQATNNENLCQSYIGWCPFW